MKTVYKKILPQYFQDVLTGRKGFELRKDEDDIQVDDVICLIEVDYYDGVLDVTGRFVEKIVKYVLRDVPQYGLMKGYCIIGFF